MTSLKDREWKSFSLAELDFEIINSKAYHAEYLVFSDGKLPYITRTKNNNGLSDIVVFANQKTNPKNTISFGAENASFFYQPYEYITGNKMYYIKSDLNKYQLLFIQRCLTKSMSELFSYGYGMIPERVRNRKFMLPINENNEPDYEFMEAYMRERESNFRKIQISKIQKRLNVLGEKKPVPSLDSKKWVAFKLKDIFTEIERGKRLKNEDHVLGIKPYVSSSAIDNGVADWIGNDTKIREFSNCLSLANSGSVGSCFYEPFKFVASDHITHLKNKDFNEYIYLFCATMISRLSEKYNFNREINDKRISKETIMLPVDNNHNPDYEYMEQYIKNLEIDKYNEYLKKLQN